MDAVVALTILATSIALVLQNAGTAKHLAEAARETEDARTLGMFLLETAPGAPGVTTGRSGAFAWAMSVTTASVAPFAQVRLCRRRVEVTALATTRRYVMATSSICPVQPQS